MQMHLSGEYIVLAVGGRPKYPNVSALPTLKEFMTIPNNWSYVGAKSTDH